MNPHAEVDGGVVATVMISWLMTSSFVEACYFLLAMTTAMTIVTPYIEFGYLMVQGVECLFSFLCVLCWFPIT